eukprot:TRINITY_DN3178_c0_g2_i1.p1 TRINITY_DN3178_c0_g2~~TRINITY_DN3178_c0_g2_i1.p1  ORF type:complete len:106 (+),score=27.58 TRINITY_DN3178_c0_g2_i1:68-385(+)
MNGEEFEQQFISKLKPYEERIQRLEESERAKELEITTLKHAIQNLNRIIDSFKTQTASKPASSVKSGSTNHTPLRGSAASHQEDTKKPSAKDFGRKTTRKTDLDD